MEGTSVIPCREVHQEFPLLNQWTLEQLILACSFWFSQCSVKVLRLTTRENWELQSRSTSPLCRCWWLTFRFPYLVSCLRVRLSNVAGSSFTFRNVSPIRYCIFSKLRSCNLIDLFGLIALNCRWRFFTIVLGDKGPFPQYRSAAFVALCRLRFLVRKGPDKFAEPTRTRDARSIASILESVGGTEWCIWIR